MYRTVCDWTTRRHGTSAARRQAVVAVCRASRLRALLLLMCYSKRRGCRSRRQSQHRLREECPQLSWLLRHRDRAADAPSCRQARWIHAHFRTGGSWRDKRAHAQRTSPTNDQSGRHVRRATEGFIKIKGRDFSHEEMRQKGHASRCARSTPRSAPPAESDVVGLCPRIWVPTTCVDLFDAIMVIGS